MNYARQLGATDEDVARLREEGNGGGNGGGSGGGKKRKRRKPKSVASTVEHSVSFDDETGSHTVRFDEL